MKKIYQAPEIVETIVALESIIANSANSGKVDTDSQVSGGGASGGRAGKEQNSGSWGNIWGN